LPASAAPVSRSFSPPAAARKKGAGASPSYVEVMEVIRKDVPIYTEWVGTADGLVNATIRAQVTGY